MKLFEVTYKRRLNDNMVWLKVYAPLVAKHAKPGQFIILRTDEYGERIPLTMAGHDEKDGTIDLTFVHGNTAIEKFMKSFNNLLKCDGVHDFGGDYQGAMKKLVANEATFASGRLNQAELYLRDMDDNYGILPNPKLTADQPNYISSIHDGVQLYGINNSSEQIPYAVLLLEAMEIESRRTVRPAYFESAVKIKYSRGSDDAEMIDLMDATIYSDFVYVWQFSAEMKGLGDWMRNNVKSPQGYNGVKRQQEAWKKGLENIMEAIKTLEENSAAS